MPHELQVTDDVADDATLTLGAHPDGEISFEGGTATVEDETLARRLADRYVRLKYVGSDNADGNTTSEDDVAELPFDPTEKTVGELEELLEKGDYSAAELDAIDAAEQAGEDRSTARDAIEAAEE